ncbi:unnamed protein product [Cuscuta campestris]|uniref:Uncharacterized protein n=1 Tax=Cuscuta campestris TaxID=132261 RepID=A0A484MWQ3_9ASTE|nr:unnamed protein product [Cuscuta campestris]
MKEINSFADFLSEMQASLKQWVPRFQKSLSDPSGSENMPEPPPPTSNKVADSPEQYKWDSLVCSSPLVSWRGDCISECERQLFLLTPLHQQPNGFLSKLKESSKPGFEEIRTEQIAQMPSVFEEILDVGNNNMLGSVKPEKSYILMTPCLKVSPPKSCVVLEPVSEYRKGSLKFRKSTPYPVAVESSDGSQDSEPSDDLNVKYPELFGIKLGNKFENRWKLAEESPKWSPPKTCALLKPQEDAAPRDCSVPLTAPNPNQKNLLPRSNNARVGRVCEFVESCTPMAKEPESCIKTGKQRHHPGENTLKRELWTKFEAASTRATCFDPLPAMQKMNLHKGFLDRLDEASSDE